MTILHNTRCLPQCSKKYFCCHKVYTKRVFYLFLICEFFSFICSVDFADSDLGTEVEAAPTLNDEFSKFINASIHPPNELRSISILRKQI